jgi:hypothetical protein
VTVRPTDAANYTTITAIVPVHVNTIHLTLALSGLKTVSHGRSVTITVLHVVAGARVTVRWQLAHKKAASTTLTAKKTSVKTAVILASKGTYTLTASATKPNYTGTAATKSMKAS